MLLVGRILGLAALAVLAVAAPSRPVPRGMRVFLGLWVSVANSP